MADTVIITGEKSIEVVTVGVQGPAGAAYTLTPATNTTLGGVIVGDNLTITGNGVLSAQPGGVTGFNNRTGNVSLTSSDVTTALTYTPLAPPANATANQVLTYNGTVWSAANHTNCLTTTNGNTAFSVLTDGVQIVKTMANASEFVYPWLRVYDNYLAADARRNIELSWKHFGPTTGGQYTATSLILGDTFARVKATTGTFIGQDPDNTAYGAAVHNYNHPYDITTKYWADASYAPISVTTYSLPVATASVLGGIKVGSNLSISNGVLSAVGSTTSLQWSNITSTPTTLSGYGITDGYSSSNPAGYITSACLTYSNITGTPAAYTLPTANTTTLGGVKVDGSSVTISNGTISVSTSYAGLGANTFTGSQNLQDNELIRAKIRDYSETVSSPTISAGTLVLNLETSNIFTVSLNAAITTLTISNPPASGSGGSFTLILTADGTARAVTWPASIKWAGGTAPTLTSTSGKLDSFAFFTSDGGTSWTGYVGGQNF